MRLLITELHNFGGFFGGDTVTLSGATWRGEGAAEQTLTIDEAALANVADRHTLAPGMLLELSFAGGSQDEAKPLRDPLDQRAPALFQLLHEQYRVDALYQASFGRLVALLALGWAWLDRNVIDAAVNGIGRLTLFFGRLNFIIDDTLLNDGPDSLARGARASGKRARRLQTGRAQDYIGYLFGGAVVLALVYLYVIL